MPYARLQSPNKWTVLLSWTLNTYCWHGEGQIFDPKSKLRLSFAFLSGLVVGLKVEQPLMKLIAIKLSRTRCIVYIY
jgi:hypothetical protein